MTSIIQLPQNLFFHSVSLLAQVEYSTEGKAPSPVSTIVGLLIALLIIVATWKVFFALIWRRASAKAPGLESVSLSWESSSGRYLASEALNIKDQQLRSR